MTGFTNGSDRKQKKLTYHLRLLHCKVIAKIIIIIATNMYTALALCEALYMDYFV